MKTKMVLLLGILLTIVSIPHNANAMSDRRVLETMFPVTFPPDQNYWHATFQPDYLFAFNTPSKHAEFKRLIKGLILNDPTCTPYFQHVQTVRATIQRTISDMYVGVGKPAMPFETIAQMIDVCQMKKVPYTYHRMLRVGNYNEVDFPPRLPYLEGEKVDSYRKIAPDDEWGLFYGDVYLFSAICANLVGPDLPDEPDHKYHPPVTPPPPPAPPVQPTVIYQKDTVIIREIVREVPAPTPPAPPAPPAPPTPPPPPPSVPPTTPVATSQTIIVKEKLDWTSKFRNLATGTGSLMMGTAALKTAFDPATQYVDVNGVIQVIGTGTGTTIPGTTTVYPNTWNQPGSNAGNTAGSIPNTGNTVYVPQGQVFTY